MIGYALAVAVAVGVAVVVGEFAAVDTGPAETVAAVAVAAGATRVDTSEVRAADEGLVVAAAAAVALDR